MSCYAVPQLTNLTFLCLLFNRGGVLTLAHWRWIFRFLACMACASAAFGWILMPRAVRPRSNIQLPPRSIVELVKRFDLLGVVLIMAALLLFNLGLTSKSPSLKIELCPCSHLSFRCNRVRLAIRKVHRAVYHQLVTLAAFLSMGSDARCSVRNDTRSNHEAVKIPRRLLHRVSLFLAQSTSPETPADLFGQTVRRNVVYDYPYVTVLPPQRKYSSSDVPDTCLEPELGPSRYFQDVLQDSSIVVAGKLSAQSKSSPIPICVLY